MRRLPTPAIAILGAAAAACTPACPEAPRPVSAATVAPPERLLVKLDAAATQEAPGLRERMASNPMSYFRAINRAFNDVVCDEWPEASRGSPVVGLHGDAHFEQYAVAADGRGLADFDEAALGPAIVDLARFATSLHLAAPDAASASASVAAFLDGYAATLRDPRFEVPEPTLARRAREAFAPSLSAWLAEVDAMIQPADVAERSAERAMLEAYAVKMRRFRPDLDASFFRVKNGGRLVAGIGSARQRKYLVRVEGPTPSPDDDVIMEAKEASSEPLGKCLQSTGSAALRSVVGEARFGGGPDRLLGVARIEGKLYSSHAWRAHYRELAASDVRSGAELAEIGRDAGAQLGRHHPELLAGPFADALREELVELVAAVRPSLDARARALAARVVAAWKHFRVAPLAGSPASR
ncbi:MAG: DUF2252 family protein [Myxococcales bacterium]|nr:DUF2252 family protein [Myxococcales bacterium]